MQNEIEKLKDSKIKIKEDSAKRAQEMKEKLEKAFVQLTANDDAAGEIQQLRAQIKEM